MGDGGPVVDDLVQGVVFVGLCGVEEVEEAVGAGGEEEGGVRWVQG